MHQGFTRCSLVCTTAAVVAGTAGSVSAQKLPMQASDASRVILKPLCSPDAGQPFGPVMGGWDVVKLSQADIDSLVANRGRPVATVTSRGTVNASRGGGLNVVFNAFGDVSQDAMVAMQIVADYYASRIDDPITVTFDVDFQPGSFGGAGPSTIPVSYAELRQLLIDDADADDTIQALLPTASVPARRFFGGPVSQETVFSITTANARALGIDVPGTDAFLFITSQADGDPSDGIGNGFAQPDGQFDDFSLVDILVHEVGHSLGFINLIEFGLEDLTSLDLFRFAELGPDNPSTDAEFTSFPRALFNEGFSPEEQHQFDFIVREHLASNASDFQASHFRETNFGDPNAERVGVMEPAITSFETGFPEYFSIGDFDAFDAIGWDYIAQADVCLPDTNGDGEVTPADFNAWISAFNAQAPACDQNSDGLCTPADFNAWISNFNAGCV